MKELVEQIAAAYEAFKRTLLLKLKTETRLLVLVPARLLSKSRRK